MFRLFFRLGLGLHSCVLEELSKKDTSFLSIFLGLSNYEVNNSNNNNNNNLYYYTFFLPLTLHFFLRNKRVEEMINFYNLKVSRG